MRDLPPYSRRLFDPSQRLSRLGGGELGGKAHGLIQAAEVLVRRGAELERTGLAADVPALVALGTDLFDTFLDRNGLRDLVAGEPPDDAVRAAFQAAPVPAEMAGDFAALAGEARIPLAVRSSSLLEDALGQPFAGVYGTKMIPGNQVQPQARLRALLDAIKLVWASTFFQEARAYRRATGTERP
ncbi:MAG TPA: PEP/pyruvate-binding domain-containing protein, partial [Thermoanaerobaculia bacterium]|nr:PEP/pyruvate-binding domain-containing protein [Thermoanaerobaculia bacterium]